MGGLYRSGQGRAAGRSGPPAPALRPSTAKHATTSAETVTGDAGAIDALKAVRKGKPLGPSGIGAEGDRDDAGHQAAALVSTAQELLRRLHALGVLSSDPGPPTGEVNEATTRAAKEFAALVGLPADGRVTGALRRRLASFYAEKTS